VPVPERSRVVSTQPGLDIIFKSASDAAACALALHPADSEMLLTLDASRCEREVRLVCDCTPVADSLIGVPSDAVLSLAISIDLQAQNPAEAIQWVALLSASVGGPYSELRKVAKRVPVKPGRRTTARWRVELPGGWHQDEKLYLGIQMAPHASPVSFAGWPLTLSP
jgi:hypothetical protein